MERTDIQKAAMLFGIVFLVVTVLGFIPGITTDYDRLTTFDDAGAQIFGIFGVNVLENIVHLLFGVAGLVAAATWAASRTYFVVGGIIYLAVWLYGLVIDLSSSANFLGLNDAANWLHFALGAVLLIVAFALGRREPVSHRTAAA
jgi:arginine exporter protein ArgO